MKSILYFDYDEILKKGLNNQVEDGEVEIKKTNKKIAVIKVRMEQVYYDIKHEHENKFSSSTEDYQLEKSYENKNYIQAENSDGNLFVEFGSEIKVEEVKDYIWVLDFEDVHIIDLNAIRNLTKVLNLVSEKYICNIKKLDTSVVDKLRNAGFTEEKRYNGIYLDVFESVFLKYIKENCTIDSITNDTGEVIKNYINLKALLENNKYMFPSCYLLATRIFKEIDDISEYSFFCHTLNGAAIAAAMSVMLGIDVLYADRLKARGRIRKLFMPERFNKETKCLIVTDLVCQGHELIRAKDIVRMLGGEAASCVGLISIELPTKTKNDKDIFLVNLDDERQKELGYEISIGYPEILNMDKDITTVK